jgi:sulfate transport system ATP-binding protein
VSVAVQKLVKRFGRSPAVHEATFEAVPGKLTALLGPSGSGKTTVLRCIAGLEDPDQGAIVIDGRDVTALSPQDRGIGMVFQSYALFKHMTVRENIAFGLKVRKRPQAEIDRRVDELLALMGLKDLGLRLPTQLSGGQRQRVAFARALAPRPKVLLLDEPFSALDARVRQELRDWTRRMHDELDVTSILVTHDQEEAMELAARVVVMNQGRIEQIGAPTEVYDEPASPFVASFVGAANVIQREGPNGVPQTEYVRPHEVKVARAAEVDGEDKPEDPLTLARVERIARLGATAKLSVRTSDGQVMQVTITKDELQALAIAEGDRITLDVHKARIFIEDYSI